jgi:hypothetical protein
MSLVELGLPILTLAVSAFNLVQYGKYLWDIRRWPYFVLFLAPGVSFTVAIIQAICLSRLDHITRPCRCACLAPVGGILTIQILQAGIILFRMPRGTLGKRYTERR